MKCLQRFVFVVVILLMFPMHTFAQMQEGGLVIFGSIGYAEVSLITGENLSTYSGLAFNAGLQMPLIVKDSKGGFATNLVGNYRFTNYENLANGEEDAEALSVSGPGVGLEFQIFRLRFGAEYNFWEYEHLFAGSNSRQLSYDAQAFTYYAGLSFGIGGVDIDVLYSRSTSKVEKDLTNLNENTGVEESVVWLRMYVSTGFNIIEGISGD